MMNIESIYGEDFGSRNTKIIDFHGQVSGKGTSYLLKLAVQMLRRLSKQLMLPILYICSIRIYFDELESDRNGAWKLPPLSRDVCCLTSSSVEPMESTVDLGDESEPFRVGAGIPPYIIRMVVLEIDPRLQSSYNEKS
jgi:hypothetical protein